MTSDQEPSDGGIIMPAGSTPTAGSPAQSPASQPVDEESGRNPILLAVPPWLDRLAAWSWRLLVIGSFMLALLWAVSWIRLAVVPTLVAIVFASALRPFVKSATDIGVPRAVAVTTIMISMLFILASGLWYAGRQAAGELDRNTVQTEAVQAEVERWLRSEPLNLEEEQIRDAESAVRDALAGGVRAWGSSSGRMVVTVAGGMMLGLILTFLFLTQSSSVCCCCYPACRWCCR